MDSGIGTDTVPGPRLLVTGKQRQDQQLSHEAYLTCAGGFKSSGIRYIKPWSRDKPMMMCAAVERSFLLVLKHIRSEKDIAAFAHV
jgi:hypothetical protein